MERLQTVKKNPQTLLQAYGALLWEVRRNLGVGRARRVSQKHASGSVLVTVSTEGYRAQVSVQKLHQGDQSGHKATPVFLPPRIL